MGTMNAIYVSKLENDRVPEIEYEYLEQNSAWYGIILSNSAFLCDSELLNVLSKTHGIAIFMSFQSTVDAFQFVLSQNGSVQRKLVYGCFVSEREWESVEGESLSWEEAILQNDDDLSENGLNMYVDSRETCRNIAEHYSLPLWDN